jgi:hypothetical protein
MLCSNVPKLRGSEDPDNCTELLAFRLTFQGAVPAGPAQHFVEPSWRQNHVPTMLAACHQAPRQTCRPVVVQARERFSLGEVTRHAPEYARKRSRQL